MFANQTFLSPDNLPQPDFDNADLETVLDYYVFRRELIEFNQNQQAEVKPAILAQQFLAEHWQHIRTTPIVYPNTPATPSTQFCLKLSEELCLIYPEDEKGIKTSRYMFLMPTVLNTEKFQHRKLEEIILTDDTEHGLIIDACIFKMSRDKPHYFHKKKGQNVPLTKKEIARIKYHSAEAHAYYDAVKVCLSTGSIGRALKALINGLTWSIEYDERTEVKDDLGEKTKIAAINAFKLFLEELAEKDFTTYKRLMEKHGNWGSLAQIWNFLLKLSHFPNELYVRIACTHALVSLKKSVRNTDFFEKENPALFMHTAVQAYDTHAAYLAAAEVGTFKSPHPRKLERQFFLLNLLSFDELKEIFARPIADKELIPLWKNLTAAQKNQLAEVLDEERLENILQQQKNPERDLDDAIISLKEEIKLHGGVKHHPGAAWVLKHIVESRPHAEPEKLTPLTELAHRTAIGVKDPNNENNLKRYPIVAEKLSELTWGQKVAAAAKVFYAVTLVGSVVALCVSTAGVPLVIPALICVFGLAVIGQAVPYWKRSPHYQASVSAVSFLNKQMHSTFNNNLQPVLPRSHLSPR